MKPYIYELICTDAAGWSGDALWGPDRARRADRIFCTRAAAVAVRRDLDACDYAATCDADAPCQPTFVVIRVASVAMLTDAALVACDEDMFDAALVACDAPLPAEYVIGESETPSRDDLMAYIETLPRAVLRAALPPGSLDDARRALSRASADLAGASSATHGLALLAGYTGEQVRLMREAAQRGLSRS